MGPTLRASCDSCNLAKVKCSKTRPCSRCKKHNLECIYGISLRAGKRAAPHHQHQWRQQEAIAPRSDVVESYFQNNWAWDVPPLSAPHVASKTTSPFMLDYPMSCPLDEKILRKESFPFPDMRFGDSQPENMPPTSTFSPALSSSARSWSTGSTSMTSPGPPSYAQSAPLVAPCNCFLATINTLSTMQQLADSSHISFDVALNQSKEAVALCSSVLKCRCAWESSVFLLNGSLIAQIINVYERPCGEWRPVEHNFPSQEPTSSMNGRLRLGSYSVDESDEERLKAEIVKMELRKAETLVAHLREIVSQSLQGPERTACEALVVFLSERFRIAYDRGNESQTGRIV